MWGSIKIYYNAINANYYDASVTFCKGNENLAPTRRMPGLFLFFLLCRQRLSAVMRISWIMSFAEMVHFCDEALPGFPFGRRSLTSSHISTRKTISSAQKMGRTSNGWISVFHSHVPLDIVCKLVSWWRLQFPQQKMMDHLAIHRAVHMRSLVWSAENDWNGFF